MKVFWSRSGHGYGNYGDKLTPLFLDYLNIQYKWAPPEEADMIGVGSLIEKIPSDFKGVIWTTGSMFEGTRSTFNNAEVLGLRGRLSLDRLECQKKGSIVLGDGGLLSDLFFEPVTPKYKLGIIPHFADQQHPLVASLAKGPDVTVIDICGPTLEVIQRVGECENILSSSLHGLILADSIGVPNRWIELGADTVSGAGFKFQDYYSNFDLSDVKPLRIPEKHDLREIRSLFSGYSRPAIDQIKARLRDSLKTLAARFSRHIDRAKTLDQVREQERRNASRREAWNREIQAAVMQLEKIIPSNERFILVDEEQLRVFVKHAPAVPFLERNGVYWGAPESDEQALRELKRLLAQGIRYVVFAWQAFWWLENYPSLKSYLGTHASVLMQNERFRAFKLR